MYVFSSYIISYIILVYYTYRNYIILSKINHLKKYMYIQSNIAIYIHLSFYSSWEDLQFHKLVSLSRFVKLDWGFYLLHVNSTKSLDVSCNTLNEDMTFQLMKQRHLSWNFLAIERETFKCGLKFVKISNFNLSTFFWPLHSTSKKCSAT